MSGAAAQLERLVRKAQADFRAPAVSVALHRADRGLWTCTVGTSGNPEHPLGPDTRFRIGSVTKTFTAVLVMQARDAGLLDLDDPAGKHLDLPAHGDATIRRLLSHTAGFQREPDGDLWDVLVAPGAATLLAQLDKAERVLPASRRFHYSNLAVAVLGQLVARLRGGTWAEVLQERVLDPLGLAATTVAPPSQAAVGYLVDPYSDAVRPEGQLDMGGAAPAAQLWSTAADMARWAAFLTSPEIIDPGGVVLPAATVDEMRWPLTPRDGDTWTSGYGLGLMLAPYGRRALHVGHNGAMPGFLAGVHGRRGDGAPDGLGVAVLGSSGTATEINDLVHELLKLAVELDPPAIAPWSPGRPAPHAYRSILGPWWGEGELYHFAWHGGVLQARLADLPADEPPAVFRPLPSRPDVFRTVSGRETGELLRLTRDDTGHVTAMHWATYRFTRIQEGFDGGPASDGSGE